MYGHEKYLTIMKEKVYSIDTGFIFEKLQSKWQDFDRDFIEDDVQFAFHDTLIKSKNRAYIGSEGDDELAYYRRRSHKEYKTTEKPENFPFLDFNYSHEPNNKFSIFSYLDSCIINKGDEYFDLFFALQLYLTDIMEIDKFLHFHLIKSFKNEFKDFKRYLDLLRKKYDFLSKNHQQLIVTFFDFLQEINVEHTIVSDRKNRPEIINETKPTESFDEILKEIEGKQNEFCKAMPLKFAIDHFIVFTQKTSKNGELFLSKEQFISFLKRALLSETDFEKIYLNVGSREKSFVVKRFYEFYSQASSKFENTIQCKDKYIRFVTDNFANWDYDNLKDNFNGKAKGQW